MKRIVRVINDLRNYLSDKKVLEVACGDADFARIVSKHAQYVLGIDISLERAARHGFSADNIEFQEMDATQMSIESETFDTVVSYNAIGHLGDNLEECFSEMIRVLKNRGHIVFIATWSMDKRLLSKLNQKDFLCTKARHIAKIKNRTYWASVWQKKG